MPRLRMSATYNSVTWYVDELGAPFTSQYYTKIVLTDTFHGVAAFTSSSEPSGVKDRVYPQSGWSWNETPSRTLPASPNNEYTRYAYALSPDGVTWRYCGSDTVNTPSAPSYDPDVPSLSYSLNGLSLTLQIDTGSNTNRVYIDRDWVTGDPDDEFSASSNRRYTEYYTLPSYSTSYRVWVQAYNNSGRYSDWTSVSFTTESPPDPPSRVGAISISNINETSLTASWGTASGASTYRVEWKLPSSSTYSNWRHVSGTSYTITGLTKGTEYDVKVYARKQLSDGSYINGTPSTIRVSTSGGRPSDWEWNSNKASGIGFNLTYTEWNNFTSRINQFRAYKSKSTYGFTQVNKGEDFTATVFNQACNAISDMNPPHVPPAPKNRGQGVYAHYFDRLRDSLNSIK